MAEKIISAIVDGGKATPGPPIGPALGPLGINAGKVVAEINEKTKAFEGTSVPIKIIVDPSTKSYRIEVGTPSVPAMIKKELEVIKGSGKAKEIKVGELTIDQVIKIAMAKSESTLAKTRQAHVKEVLGACVSLGALVDGKDPRDVQKEVDAGKHNLKIEGKSPLVMPTKPQMAEMKKKYAAAQAAAEATAKAAEAAAAPAPAEAAPAPAADKKEEKKGKKK